MRKSQHREAVVEFEMYMCRHGESDGNQAGVCQGFTPGRLTSKGKEQAKLLGPSLFPSETNPYSAIWCSDLNRVQETCFTALTSANKSELYHEVIFEALLREKNAGALEGLPRRAMEEGRKKHGNERTFRPKNGECWDDLQLRAKEFMRRLLSSIPKEYHFHGRSTQTDEQNAEFKADSSECNEAVTSSDENYSQNAPKILVFTSGGFIKEFINAFILSDTSNPNKREYYPNCASNCSTYVFKVCGTTVQMLVENKGVKLLAKVPPSVGASKGSRNNSKLFQTPLASVKGNSSADSTSKANNSSKGSDGDPRIGSDKTALPR
jgi:broad specificity phosphatase PhoE